MAVIKTGPVISDIRGSIGDVTFSRNRSGLFIRARATPTLSGEWYELSQLYFRNANAAWAKLSDSEVLEWSSFAKTYGNTSSFIDGYKELDPRVFFISCSMHRQLCGYNEYVTPLPPGNPGFLDYSIIANGIASLSLTIFGGSYDANYAVYLSAQRPQNLTIRSINSAQSAKFYNSIYSPSTPENIFGAFYNRFDEIGLTIEKRSFFTLTVIHLASGVRLHSLIKSIVGLFPIRTFTIGDTNIWPNNNNTSAQEAVQYTFTDNAFISSISIYLDAPTGTRQFGIYSNSSEKPLARLSFVAVDVSTSPTGWITVNLPSTLFFASGTKIWIACATSTTHRTRQAVGTFKRSIGTLSTVTLPNIWTEASQNTIKRSSYPSGIF